MSRPIDIWPPQRHRGRPGYSGRGLDAVSPAAETPLSVAATIVDNQVRDEVWAEAEAKFGRDLSRMDERSRWAGGEITARGMARYRDLCGSLGLVLEALESAKPTPAIKALIRQVNRAHRQNRRAS